MQAKNALYITLKFGDFLFCFDKPRLHLQIVNLSINTLMHYGTKELTTFLQELTNQSAEQPIPKEATFPHSIAADEFTVSEEVESFLLKTQEYSAKTRNVRIGIY